MPEDKRSLTVAARMGGFTAVYFNVAHPNLSRGHLFEVGLKLPRDAVRSRLVARLSISASDHIRSPDKPFDPAEPSQYQPIQPIYGMAVDSTDAA